MQTKVNDKHISVCLLLCFLFLISYLSLFHTSGIILSDGNIWDAFSPGGGSEPSSMNGGANAGHHDYMAAADVSAQFSLSSLRQSRWLTTKAGYNILPASTPFLVACLIYYSKLSGEIYPPSNSSIITVFLHKKDGMK
ncbi:hypothetical protein [Candidatus Formimonas warabiya]|uniref:Uncharacterized protein n=1 Tax=Formimonas warabiya TaxID=1761012 RepID=A0A3G1KZ40_FORW1|nr:hypothetical protein [Candidatus Formimonas warabiya]ATW27475.1 hypothetical protein DCMF_24405 [Candidatus Formimonas warabiya]